MEYKIRQATREELDIAVGWAAKEGWNPGLGDAEVFWKTDPEGFVALEVDGEMVGSGSIVSYGGKFGFMGFFIVKPEFRGKGWGTKLWHWRRDKLLSRLNKGAPIGMDGVFAMQPFYAKGGFVLAHRDMRMEGVGKIMQFSENVKAIEVDDLDEISSLDVKFFGYERRTFLQGWLLMNNSQALKYVDGGEIKGYGVVRKCQTGYKIGPLFADNYEVADELFRAMSTFADGEPIYLDVPEINIDGMKLAKNYNMKECFGCARMYYSQAPALPYDKIFGVTSFELG
ncbi:GNAT family N-acetyltransferase [Candidatus Shapirobacteria bacterium]|nr:GNAT family N-acetyltransferase [Candidatus Shapirobacteria bacterium]